MNFPAALTAVVVTLVAYAAGTHALDTPKGAAPVAKTFNILDRFTLEQLAARVAAVEQTLKPAEPAATPEPPRPMPGATIRIEHEDGRVGSGVHIGEGFFLTAQHVVESHEKVRFLGDLDSTWYEADVMWANAAYDAALIRLAGPYTQFATAPLTCRAVAVGEDVETIGNLHRMRFFRSWGRVSVAKVEKIGPWQEVIVVSSANGPGMSGGPALDRDGRVVGITVGARYDHSGYAFIVPSTTLCKLLGRT